MSNRSELVFEYGDQSFIVSASCSVCEERMPLPPRDVTLAEERVLWFAKEFITHKIQSHSTEAGGNPEDVEK